MNNYAKLNVANKWVEYFIRLFVNPIVMCGNRDELVISIACGEGIKVSL